MLQTWALPCPLLSSATVKRRLPSGLKATLLNATGCFNALLIGFPFAESKTRAVSSRIVARRRPSRLKVTLPKALLCGSGSPTGLPVAASHNRTMPPSLHCVTIRVPVELNETPPRSSGCSCRIGAASAFPVAASHKRAVRSLLAVAMRAPSGLNTAATISSSCRMGSPICAPVLASHKRAVLSALVVKMRRPSGLKTAAWISASGRNTSSGGVLRSPAPSTTALHRCCAAAEFCGSSRSARPRYATPSRHAPLRNSRSAVA